MIKLSKHNTAIQLSLHFEDKFHDGEVDVFLFLIKNGSSAINTADTIFYNNMRSKCGNAFLSPSHDKHVATLDLDELAEEYDRIICFISNLSECISEVPFRFTMDASNGISHEAVIDPPKCIDKRLVVLASLYRKGSEWEYIPQFRPYRQPIHVLFPMLEHNSLANAAWLKSHADNLHVALSTPPQLSEIAWFDKPELEDYLEHHYHPSMARSQGECVLDQLNYFYGHSEIPDHHQQLMKRLLSDGCMWWKTCEHHELFVCMDDENITTENALNILNYSDSQSKNWLLAIFNLLDKDEVRAACINNNGLANDIFQKFKADYIFEFVDSRVKKDRLSDDLGM
jgi:stress response protein SCP2